MFSSGACRGTLQFAQVLLGIVANHVRERNFLLKSRAVWRNIFRSQKLLVIYQ
jgi:hypothetical protein